MDKVSALNKNFNDLKIFTVRNDVPKVLRTCTSILEAIPDHIPSKICTAVCHIKQKKYAEALKILQNFPNSLHLEKAYCFYCLGQVGEALSLLEKSSDESNSCKELKAQLMYHSFCFQDAIELYKDIQLKDNDFIEERQTNINAVLASSALLSSHPLSVDEFLLKTYEDTFNKACYHIGKCEYNQATKMLKHTRDKFLVYSKNEELTESEMSEDLALFSIQLAFVYSALNDVDSVKFHLNDSILNSIKNNNHNLMTIARNNLLCITKNHGMYDYRKRLKKLEDSLNKSSKLLNDQKMAVHFNRFLVYYNTNNIKDCDSLLEKLKINFKDHYIIQLMQIYMMIKKCYFNDAIDQIDKSLKTNESNIDDKLKEFQMIELLLIKAELQKSIGLTNTEIADTIMNIPNYYMYPNLVFYIFDKYVIEQEVDKAFDIVEHSFIKYLDAEMLDENYSILEKFCTKLIILYIKYNCIPRGVNYFKINHNKIDHIISLKRLVEIFLSQIENQSVESNSTSLQDSDFFNFEPIVKLEMNSDANNNLDDINEINIKKPNTKRKRKKLDPKFQNLTTKPDPERWLPMHERSYYKPQKGKKKQQVGGHQGAQSQLKSGTEFTSDNTSSTVTSGSSKPNTRYANKSKKKRSRR